MRRIYIDYIGNSIKMPIDLSKHSLDGLSNFSEKMECLKLKYKMFDEFGIVHKKDIEVINKLTNISEIFLDNVSNYYQIIRQLDHKKIKYLSINPYDIILSSTFSYIFDNFLGLETLELHNTIPPWKQIKNLAILKNLTISLCHSEYLNITDIYEIKTLQTLHITLKTQSYILCPEYFEKFDSLKSLTIIDSYGNNMSYVSDVVKNYSLESLTFGGLSLRSCDVELLANKKLKKLSLDCRSTNIKGCLGFFKDNVEKFKDMDFKITFHTYLLDINSCDICKFLKNEIKNFYLLPIYYKKIE
jgi:hypothetical protein